MATTDHRYTFEEFLADFLYVEELKPSWPKDIPLDELVARHFMELHGDSEQTEWRYNKFMLVVVYVSENIHAFNSGDLAVIGSERALAHGKLFRPVFDYAIAQDVEELSQFPEPDFFHDQSA